VERGDPLFEAQVLSYLRASGKHIGLLINFNSHLLARVSEILCVGHSMRSNRCPGHANQSPPMFLR
jgi:hypothetical protein